MTQLTHNPTKLAAFLKRWSQVRVLPGTLLFSRAKSAAGRSQVARLTRQNGPICTDPVHGPDPLEPLRRVTPGVSR